MQTHDTSFESPHCSPQLSQHNVSGRENAFDKLVNLFLAKVVDETNNPENLHFYWKGTAYDDDFQLQDRLQRLYRDGMIVFFVASGSFLNLLKAKSIWLFSI